MLFQDKFCSSYYEIHATCFDRITLIKQVRRCDSSAISISFPCTNSVTGRVKSRIYLVRTKVAIKWNEDINF